MSNPLVTIIITVFKRAEYLQSAIQSALSQSMEDIEVIVSDDGPSVAAQAISLGFSSDSRLRYRSNNENIGTPLNIAAALREARGKYVCILNDDDLLEPKMVELLMPPLERNPGVTVSFGNFEIIDGGGNSLDYLTRRNPSNRARQRLGQGALPDSFEFAVRRGMMVAMGSLFRRSSCDIDWLRPQVAAAYDYWLAISLASQGGRFYFVPQTVMKWRHHSNSESARVHTEKYEAELFIYSQLAMMPLTRSLRKYVDRERGRFLALQGIENLLREVSINEARKCLRRSVRHRPSLVTFLVWLYSFLPQPCRYTVAQIWINLRPVRRRFWRRFARIRDSFSPQALY